MKKHWNSRSWCLAAASGLALFASTTITQAVPDRVLGVFDTTLSTAGQTWGRGWGSAQPTYGETGGNPGGCMYVSGNYGEVDSQTGQLTGNACAIYGVLNGNPWWHPNGAADSFDMTQYKSVEYDIKWDAANSTVPLADFANFQLNTVYDGGSWPVLGYPAIPAAAGNGWVHVSVTIDPTIANLGTCYGIMFQKWIAPGPLRDATNTFAFWIDNVVLKGTDAPPPPPTMRLETPVAGLNMIRASGGQYDRQDIRTVGTNYSWIGASGPVTYSFTLSKVAGMTAFMQFVPGTPDPTRPDSDWHEASVLYWRTSGDPANGSGWSDLHWKVNTPEANGALWDNTLGGVWCPNVLGTWSITFTPDNQLTITAPNGNTLVTNVPAEFITALTATNIMKVNIGVVPNGTVTNAIPMVVVASAAFTGVPHEPDINANFVGQTSLDTNIWSIVATAGAVAVQTIPTTAVQWVNWTLPANGFNLQTKATLTPGIWSDVTNAAFTAGPENHVLITTAEAPAGDSAFFRLQKRTFSKLQILLPGETAAPGTPTGKTGTPTAQQVGLPFSVVVNAVDSDWYPIAGVMDTVALTSTDFFAILPGETPLGNGTVTLTDLSFGTAGTWTITASDTTDNTKTPATSSPVTAN